jgi:hypothetical protein
MTTNKTEEISTLVLSVAMGKLAACNHYQTA